MKALQVRDSSGIELIVMPPFNSNTFIIVISNHASRCMDNCTKHFSELKQKYGTLTNEIAKELEVKACDMFYWIMIDDLGQVHHLAFKQHMFLTFLVHCSPSNMGVSKQMTTFCIDMASKWSNQLTTASFTWGWK